MNDMPKVVRDMEAAKLSQRSGEWQAWVFALICGAAGLVFLAMGGCAVSLSFQPAKWNAPSTVESGGKQGG